MVGVVINFHEITSVNDGVPKAIHLLTPRLEAGARRISFEEIFESRSRPRRSLTEGFASNDE